MVFTELVIHLAEALLSARPGETATTLCSALETLAGALDMDRSRVYSIGNDGDFHGAANLGHGAPTRMPPTIGSRLLSGSVELAPVLNGVPVLLAAMPADPEAGSLLDQLKRLGLCSLFILPLKREQQVSGLLVLERSGASSAWKHTDNLGLLLLSGVVSAASERILAEERLSRLETSYRELFDSVSDPIYIQDAQGRFVDVNQGAEKLYGYPREYFLGKTPEFLSAPGRNDMDTVITHVVAALNGEARRFEFWGIDCNGREFPKEVRVYPGHFDGQPVTFAFAIDISERLAREQESRRRDERALHARKLESLGVLAGGIAHDFNNLLQTVLGNAELALAEQPEGSTGASCLKDVIQASNHAADLCRQMLAYSGRGHFVLGRVDLAEEIRTIGRILEVARPPGTRIVFDLPALPVVMLGDVAQVRQVLMNLLTNAMEAIGDEPGQVRVAIDCRSVDPRTLTRTFFTEQSSPGTYAVVEVSDTGCGMDAETQTRLFDPFFTTKMMGRGLGMSAVLGIVRSHGGMIQVESSTDSGTTFQVLFPLHPGEEVVVPVPVPLPAMTESRLRILLADDQDSTRRICRRMLEKQGHMVCDAADGQQAWLCFIENPERWSLALLDQSMPGLTGAQLLARIRECRPDLPVILMSGYEEGEIIRNLLQTDDGAQAEDMEGGAAGPHRVRFLPKPFTGIQLAEAMAALLVPFEP